MQGMQVSRKFQHAKKCENANLLVNKATRWGAYAENMQGMQGVCRAYAG